MNLLGKDTLFSRKRTLAIRGKLVELDRPLIMGVLNITPDSFYPGSRVENVQEALNRAGKMMEEGAWCIDLGACSSRPGAENTGEKEEWSRLQPVLHALRREFPSMTISIDTYHASIAQKAVLDEGADMVNDISGGMMDEKMITMVGGLNVPMVIMHMKGTPHDMQEKAVYKDLIGEIMNYFHERIHKATEAGIHDIILDPGFGFAKTIEQNYLLLNRMDEFSIFGLPLMAGLSRKSMIHRLLNISPEEALNGTTALNTIALLKGADILRVHDVKEAMEVMKMVGKMTGNWPRFI
jgi:dihydropteroate synthase